MNPVNELKEFKAFVLRGNVVDLAIAVVIGTAFKDVVDSLVKDIFTPLLSVPGHSNFDALTFHVRGSVFAYGHFLNQVVTFLSIAAVVFFFVVKPINLLMARHKTEPEVESTTKPCGHCLSKVPVGASVCAFCTRDLGLAA